MNTTLQTAVSVGLAYLLVDCATDNTPTRSGSHFIGDQRLVKVPRDEHRQVNDIDTHGYCI